MTTLDTLEGYQLVRLSKIQEGDVLMDQDTGDKKLAADGWIGVFVDECGREAGGAYVYRKYEPVESDVPTDLAGWQNVRDGIILKGDLLVCGDKKEWAAGAIGRKVQCDGTFLGYWNIYRKIPVAKQGLANDGTVLKNDQPEPAKVCEKSATQQLMECVRKSEPGMLEAYERALGGIEKQLDSKPTNPKDAIGSGKLPLDLVPETAVAYMALAFLEGGLHYGAHNYRAIGVRASIYYAACRRHLMKWWNGEWADKKTGVPHLASALACIAIILDADSMKKLTDDRPPANPGLVALIDSLGVDHVARLKELFKNENPKHWTIQDTP